MSLVEKIEDESWPTEITEKDFEAGKIANLPDRPNRGADFGEAGLKAQQLKAYFDKNIELLKGRVNAIIKYGDPNTIAGKIEIGSINGWDDIATLYDFIVAMNEGGLSDKFFVKFEDEEQLYVLNEFLQSLQKDKVQSKQGGADKGKVYIIDEDSDDALLGYSEDATPHSIVKRTESGDVLLPEGSSDERAAISRKDAAALLSEAVTKDAFEEEKIRTNTFVKSAKVEYDEATHVIRLTFTDGNGETDTSSVDLPLEMAFVGARLEDGNLVFTLQNGQEVSVPIGDVLGGLITSGALAQSLSGNESDKAPSVKAVNGGLAGKVDAITDTWSTYTTDGNGNTVAKKLASKPADGGIALYNTGGVLKTNAPVADNDASNKKYVDDGLVGKFSLPSKLGAWCLLGIGNYNEETGEYTPHRYARDWYGSGNATIAAYAIATDEKLWTGRNPMYTLGVPDPLYPIQVANKRYVDNKCRDLQQGVYNALGVQYAFVVDEDYGLEPNVPANAMQFACIESVGNAVACKADGTEIGSVDIQVTANYMPVDTTTLPVYVDMGDGLNLHYELTNGAPDGTEYVKVTGRKIIYQVKVGG